MRFSSYPYSCIATDPRVLQQCFQPVQRWSEVPDPLRVYVESKANVARDLPSRNAFLYLTDVLGSRFVPTECLEAATWELCKVTGAVQQLYSEV